MSMPMPRSVVRIVGVAILLMATTAATAFAQSKVRVVADRATIWRRDARIPATTVRAGTELEVVGREGDWYVVVIPSDKDVRELGIIAVSQVMAVAGTPPPPQRPPARGGAAPTRRPIVHRPIEVYGFGHVSYGAWLAHHTFDAVFDTPDQPMFGGGGEVRVKGRLFVQGAIERFEKTGQRVFVNNGEVFRLGIADTVRVIPVYGTVGYRHDGKATTSYFGGGAGRYLYKERSDFSDPSEDIDQTFTSYHAVAGVEFGNGALRTALEIQFTTVPNALGTSGASAAFNEHNLGGFQIRLKILGGR